MTWPEAVVNTLLSWNGPQVGRNGWLCNLVERGITDQNVRDPDVGRSTENAVQTRATEVTVYNAHPLTPLGEGNRNATGDCSLALRWSCARDEKSLVGSIRIHEHQVRPNTSGSFRQSA